MPNSLPQNSQSDAVSDAVPEMELTDADILDAMRHIPGYLDISTEDFRTIYHLAHHHAVERLLENFSVGNLVRTEIKALRPDMPLGIAAEALVQSGYKALPVVDEAGMVLGMLTETDFLRRLKVDTFLKLLLNMMDDTFEFKHQCHTTPVSATMTAPAITIPINAGFREVIGAFRQHQGRSIPVVKDDGQLLGLLLRKDFVLAYPLESLR